MRIQPSHCNLGKLVGNKWKGVVFRSNDQHNDIIWAQLLSNVSNVSSEVCVLTGQGRIYTFLRKGDEGLLTHPRCRIPLVTRFDRTETPGPWPGTVTTRPKSRIYPSRDRNELFIVRDEILIGMIGWNNFFKGIDKLLILLHTTSLKKHQGWMCIFATYIYLNFQIPPAVFWKDSLSHVCITSCICAQHSF